MTEPISGYILPERLTWLWAPVAEREIRVRTQKLINANFWPRDQHPRP